MKRPLQYKIISERVEETCGAWMPAKRAGEEKQKRARRVAGHSDLKKIKQNERAAGKQFARELNCNFQHNDLLVTLEYDAQNVPPDYAAAQTDVQKYMRKVRAAIKKETGENPRYTITTGNWNVRDNKPARLHHHIVIQNCSVDLLRKLWTKGGFSFRPLDNTGDYSNIAFYLCKNVHGMPNVKKWTTSRGNMKKPIYTELEPANADFTDVKETPGAFVKEKYVTGEDGFTTSAYIRAVLPEAPTVRGGKVIYPKRKRKGDKINATKDKRRTSRNI